MSPSEDAVFERLRLITVEQLGVDLESITPTSSFVDDLNADSLDMIELAMEIAEKFSVPVPDLGQMVTVGDAVRYVISMRE